MDGTALEIDPYFLDVVGVLEKEGMLPEDTHEQWSKEIKSSRNAVRWYAGIEIRLWTNGL